MNCAKEKKIASTCCGCTPKTEAGFTLIEVMIAVSIIAIVLITVYKMHAQTISMNYIAKSQTIASLLAQRKMAEIETAPHDLVTSDSGDFGDAFPGYRWAVSVDEVESEYFGDIVEDLKKVDVAVSLNEDENIYRVRAYLFVRD